MAAANFREQMKLPKRLQAGSSWWGNSLYKETEAAWKKTAIELGVRYGVFVDVECRREPIGDHYETVEVHFKMDDKTYKSADELERTLKLKAFT